MKNLLVALLLFLPFVNYAQLDTKGTEFWLGYMENLTLDFNNSPSFSIRVYGELDGTGVITAPASPGIEVPFSYQGGEVKKVDLPMGILYAQGSEEVANYGFKISTSNRVNVSAVHARWYFSEASMVLPTTMLSGSYRVLATPDLNLSAASYSSFVIVATKDNSTVEITPSVLTVGFHGPGFPFTVELDAGESYQVQAIGDLSGTEINEINGNALAVFGGAKQADIYCSVGADSHIWDQMYPGELLGTEYALIPYIGQGIAVAKVLAVEDNTDVSIDGFVLITLQSGETYEYTLTQPRMLNTSAPVQVALVHPSNGCVSTGFGDPNMTILAPTSFHTMSTKFWHENIFAAGFETKYGVTLVTANTIDGSPEVFLDGQNIGGEFAQIGSSAFAYCEKEVSVGQHEVIAPNGVLGYAYALADYDAYTYHLAYQLPISTGIEEDASPIQIASNPVQNELKLFNNSNQNITSIHLLTLEGKIVSPEFNLNKNASLTMEISSVAPGLYFLTYVSQGSSFSAKVVVE